MNAPTKHNFHWSRYILQAMLVVALGFSAFSKASASHVEWVASKALQQSLVEWKATFNGIESDPPDAKAIVVRSEALVQTVAPQTIGASNSHQFSAMVHQLRDRLMHAPPAYL